MNCEEKIKNCNSIVFEDYSLSKKPIVIEDDPEPEQEPEDPGMIALTYYHFLKKYKIYVYLYTINASA